MKGRASAWPWGIGIGLGVVVLANAIMIHLAVSHPSAPAAADHYGESLRWDEVQQERQRARALGWTVELRPCARLAAEGCPLRLEVRDAEGNAVEGLHAEVSAQRADDVRLDRRAELGDAGAGVYDGVLALARPGLYSVSIRLEGGPVPWMDDRRIEVMAP